MERETKAETSNISYICDKCNEGEMIPNGQTEIKNESVLWKHKCNKCEHVQYLKEIYSMINGKSNIVQLT